MAAWSPDRVDEMLRAIDVCIDACRNSDVSADTKRTVLGFLREKKVNIIIRGIPDMSSIDIDHVIYDYRVPKALLSFRPFGAENDRHYYAMANISGLPLYFIYYDPVSYDRFAFMACENGIQGPLSREMNRKEFETWVQGLTQIKSDM